MCELEHAELEALRVVVLVVCSRNIDLGAGEIRAHTAANELVVLDAGVVHGLEALHEGRTGIVVVVGGESFESLGREGIAWRQESLSFSYGWSSLYRIFLHSICAKVILCRLECGNRVLKCGAELNRGIMLFLGWVIKG